MKINWNYKHTPEKSVYKWYCRNSPINHQTPCFSQIFINSGSLRNPAGAESYFITTGRRQEVMTRRCGIKARVLWSSSARSALLQHASGESRALEMYVYVSLHCKKEKAKQARRKQIAPSESKKGFDFLACTRWSDYASWIFGAPKFCRFWKVRLVELIFF